MVSWQTSKKSSFLARFESGSVHCTGYQKANHSFELVMMLRSFMSVTPKFTGEGLPFLACERSISGRFKGKTRLSAFLSMMDRRHCFFPSHTSNKS